MGRVAASIELFQSFFLVLDDVMDQSRWRRGKPAWYTLVSLIPTPHWEALIPTFQPDIGLSAVNDALVLDCSIDWIVRGAMATEKPTMLKAVMQEFREVIINQTTYPSLSYLVKAKWRTVMGQMLDTGTTNRVGDFSWERYRRVVEYKTAHYSYYLPISLGFHLTETPFDVKKLKSLTYRMGYLFQAVDDYIDCFARSEEAIGKKVGVDLAEGKCTWVGGG